MSATKKYVVDPDSLTFDNVIGNLPTELFQKSTRRALKGLAISVMMCIFGYALVVVMPWYCLPITWGLLGLFFTAIHSIVHDCRRGSFSSFPVVNSVVGWIVSAPLLIPFESWKAQQKEVKSAVVMEQKQAAAMSWSWFLTSAEETWNAHFVAKQFTPGSRRKLAFSLATVYLFSAILFPTLISQLGIWGFAKFWLLPFLAYHFWISTFTSWVYRVPFTKDMSVKFSIAFPTKLPRWVNFLTNDINYVLSLSGPLLQSGAESLEKFSAIPKHNLKSAFEKVTEAIIENSKLASAQAGPAGSSSSLNDDVPITVFDKIRRAAAGVNWIPAIWILSTPLIGLYGALTTPLQFNTFVLAMLGYLTAGLGITVGYHRLFAHRAFSCHWPTRLLILLCGTSAFQGSCLWWARDHRAHHRFVDSEKDPYNSRKGFFWAHMGWLLVKQNKAAVGKADCADLEADPLLAWQEKYFLVLSSSLAIFLPVCIAGLGWGDWRGGFFYAAVLRSVLVMQSTFCVNSLAHYVGDYTFSDKHTPRDSPWVSFVTFGEGYHNFHHEFPYDFRNGVHWYAYDPSKWTIWFLNLFGLTYDLKRFPANEIEKGRLQMKEKAIQRKLAKLNWGPDVLSLPLFTLDDVKRRCLEGSSLIIVDKLVHDVAQFIPNHPGGEAIIKAYLGKDATAAFNGSVYDHSNGAHNLLGTLRIGRLVTEEERAQLQGETAPLTAVIAPPMQDVE